MRRFGGDRIRSFMDWAGLEDDVPIDNGMINKSIENAQTKVEAHHFDMRKHLVEYDDVVNTHRDVIYAERNKILSGADLKANIQEMVGAQLGDIVNSSLGDRRPSDWDIDGLLAEVGTVLPPPEDLYDDEQVVALGFEGVEDRLLTHAERMYEDMEQAMGQDIMREIERRLMLQAVDTNWVQHLTAMENLRQGIGLYAYGQRDPLVMYKKEGMEQFQRLQQKIQSDIAHSIFRLQVELNQSVIGGRQRNGSSRRRNGSSQRVPPRETTLGSTLRSTRWKKP